MFRNYQYRLRPNKTQESHLDDALNKSRYLYNAALQERKDAYEKKRITISKYEQMKSLTIIRREDEEMRKYSVGIMRGALEKLDRSYKSFFRRVKSGQKPGFPRFKGKNRYDSIELAASNFYQVKGNRVHINGIGDVRFHNHRSFPEQHKHCGLIIRKDPKGWVICFRIDIGEAPEKIAVKREIGIDMGLNAFVSTSDGRQYPAPNTYRHYQKILRRKHRAVARCVRGSNTRKKRVQSLRVTHEKIKNSRKDFHHKLSREIINEADMVVVEDLKVTNMVKNQHLSKSISDAGWASFLEKVEYKAEEAGKRFIKVDPRNTSQHCSGCGAVVKKSLAVRTHKCPECGLVLDRDINAARNILKKSGRDFGALSAGLPALVPEAHHL